MLALNGLDYMDGRAAKCTIKSEALPNSATVTPGHRVHKNLSAKSTPTWRSRGLN